jgi:hypothetical protein
MDTNKPHAQSSTRGGKLPTYRRSSAVRLFTPMFALVAGVTVLPGAMLSAVRENRASSVDPPADGSISFTRTTAGNIARINAAGM